MIFPTRIIAIACLLMLPHLRCIGQKMKTDSLLQVLQKMETRGEDQNNTAYVDLINEIGLYYLINQSYDSSMLFAQRGNALSVVTNYPKGRVDALRVIGSIAASNGDNAAALEAFSEALMITQQIHYSEGEGKIYRQIGIIY